MNKNKDLHQLSFYEKRNTRQRFPVTVICERMKSPENLGMIFRVCEAMGVGRVMISDDSAKLESIKFQRAARATYKTVPYKIFRNIHHQIDELIAEGYKPVALEITSDSQPISSFKIFNDEPVAVILGSEKYGVSREALKIVHSCYHIPMYGRNSSMNVVNAASVFLYSVVNQYSIGCK